MKIGRIISKAFGWLVLVAMVWAALNYEALADQWALQTYHPVGAVATLTNELHLTTKAKAIWYRSRPQIDDKTAFNVDCQPGQGELELGCYWHGRIYILQINNPSLAPEMEVVAAHELLHAAYTRLSSGQRQTVNTELEQAYAGIHDSDLDARMADYAKSEPGQRDNELHSILGSELASLPTALDSYYTSYFTNRQLVTAAEAQYTAVFTGQKAKIDAELAQIQALKAQLEALNYRMNSYRAEGQIQAYNNLVPQQNALVAEVNNDITTYQNDVTDYNDLSASLNSQQITPSDVQPVQ